MVLHGNTTQYAYDSNGYIVTLTDAIGNRTTYENDAKGNVLSLTFADGTQIKYTYDAMGNQTSMTDPLGNQTHYTYDALGNRIETLYADGTKETVAYTPSYQVKSVSNALKETVRYDVSGESFNDLDLRSVKLRDTICGRSSDLSCCFKNSKVSSHTFFCNSHIARINAASFSQDETKILTCADDGTAAVWDRNSENRIKSFQCGIGTVNAQFNMDSTRILAVSSGKILEWPIEDKVPLFEYSHPNGCISPHAYYNKDGTCILYACHGN